MNDELGRGPDRFDCELPATAQSLARLRANFGPWAAHAVDDPALQADLVLVLSEMAASTLPPSAICETGDVSPRLRATAWRDGDGVVLEVQGDVARARDAQREFHAAAETTRGMTIVASLAEVFSVRHGNHTNRVRARLGHAGRRTREPAQR